MLLLLLLSFFPFINAQSDSDSNAVQIEAIEAHFSNAAIVPSLLTSFTPVALLNVSFDGVGTISPGQPLSEDQVKQTPNVVLTPANSSVQLGNNFTLTMVDAGPVGTDESQGQTRHWLVNGVTLSGSSPNETVSTVNAVAVTEYAGPAPPSGSGPHRYVILLYSQPSTFSPPANLSQPNIGVSVFNVNDYAETSGLGLIVAATYFTVQEGSASFTPSVTSAVVTSTLPVPQSTTSSSSAPSSSSSVSSTSTSSALNLNALNYGLCVTLSVGAALIML